MDEATTDTAAVLRRVLRRTLTVLGGTVAGTAIAWAVSAACASAATPPCESPLAAVPGVEQLAGTDAGQQIVEPVSDVVCSVDRLVPAVGDLGDEADRITGDAGLGRVKGWVPPVPIDIDDLGRSDRPGAQPAPGGGSHEPPSLVQPAGEQTAAAPAKVQPSFMDTQAAPGGPEPAGSGGLTRRGSPQPEPVAPRAPVKPVSPAPATVPAPGSSGHTGGGGADSPTAAAFCSCADRHGLPRGRALPVGDARAAGEPGTAPGVTPD